MLKDVKKNLRMKQKEKGGAREPTQAVLADALILVEEEGWEIQSREKGGRKWIEETLGWAREEGWITGNKETAVRAAAKKLIHLREGPELACLELGSGWSGANEGLERSGRWDRVVDVDGVQQNMGKTLGLSLIHI